MAIALRGSVGTVATGTTSCSPTFAQATAAGNLLICWTAGSVQASTPSGWSAVGNGDGNNSLFYKANCGASETAPTISAGGASFIAAVLAEFTGAATTSPLDQAPTGAVGVTSPQTTTAAAPDTTAGSLVIASSYFLYSMAATKTTTHTDNNGATATNAGNNDATSTLNHYRFSYGITTGNASADSCAAAFTITNITSAGVILASFKVAGAAAAKWAPSKRRDEWRMARDYDPWSLTGWQAGA